MKKKVAVFSAVVAAVFSISMFLSAQQSPVGTWKTVDDESGKEKSWIQITEKDGKLFGTIIKLLQEPDGGKDKLCTKCKGSFKDKNIVGMTNMWGLKQGSGNVWEGGNIMDPNNGKTYKCLVELQDGGNKLRVRGFIGFSLIGRNQFWFRVK